MVDSQLHAHVVASRSAEIAARVASPQMLHRAELARARKPHTAGERGPTRRLAAAVPHALARLVTRARPARQVSAQG
jgi:hypothetical protein